MNEKTDLRALRGQIVYSESSNKLKICENGYLVYEANEIKGVYPILPEEYEGILIEDYGDRIIVPGFVDLHVHAPQYAFRGLGMDMELLDWLETNTFPEESKYKDIIYVHLLLKNHKNLLYTYYLYIHNHMYCHVVLYYKI